MRVINYVQDSTADGEGLRDVLFVSGCNHKCEGCHNKRTWDSSNGVEYTPEMGNKIIVTLKRLSEPAITLSGGDPLHPDNAMEIYHLCKELKNHNVNIWLYTGMTLAELKDSLYRPILSQIDVLVDGKYIKELHDDTCLYRGSSNQKIYRIDHESHRDIIKDCSKDFKA